MDKLRFAIIYLLSLDTPDLEAVELALRVKNLLTGDQQLAVARTVEALAEGKPNPETDSYLFLGGGASEKRLFSWSVGVTTLNIAVCRSSRSSLRGRSRTLSMEPQRSLMQLSSSSSSPSWDKRWDWDKRDGIPCKCFLWV
ncbi:hypothetical protein YC2023_019607 [Brassica napus]